LFECPDHSQITKWLVPQQRNAYLRISQNRLARLPGLIFLRVVPRGAECRDTMVLCRGQNTLFRLGP